MKTEITKPGGVFVPVGITLTFETQEELDKLRTLFNSAQVQNYLNTSNIVEILDNAGAHHNRYIDFCQHCLKTGRE